MKVNIFQIDIKIQNVVVANIIPHLHETGSLVPSQTYCRISEICLKLNHTNCYLTFPLPQRTRVPMKATFLLSVTPLAGFFGSTSVDFTTGSVSPVKLDSSTISSIAWYKSVHFCEHENWDVCVNMCEKGMRV